MKKGFGLAPLKIEGQGIPYDVIDVGDTDCFPYDVICARCNKNGNSEAFMLEEGDEWECPECWDRNEKESLIARGRTR